MREMTTTLEYLPSAKHFRCIAGDFLTGRRRQVVINQDKSLIPSIPTGGPNRPRAVRDDTSTEPLCTLPAKHRRPRSNKRPPEATCRYQIS